MAETNDVLRDARLAAQACRMTEARRHYLDQIAALQAKSDETTTATALIELGNLELHLGNPAEAQKYFAKVQAIANLAAEQSGYLQIGLGDLKRAQAQHDDARKHYEQAEGILDNLHNHAGTAAAARGKGEVERQLNHHDKARQFYNTALQRADVADDPLVKARTLTGLGELERGLGRHTEAQLFFRQALALDLPKQSPLDAAQAYLGFGDLARTIGSADEAQQHYNAALVIFEKAGSAAGRAAVNLGMGELHHKRGENDDARRCWEDALLAFRAVPDHHGAGHVLRSLGDLDRALGRVEDAQKHYEAARQCYQGVGDSHGEANAVLGLGHIAGVQDRVREARKFYESALLLYGESKDRLGEANVLASLADLDLESTNYIDARTNYERALKLYTTEGTPLGKANVLLGLGDVAYGEKDYEAARKYLNEALALYSNLTIVQGAANTLLSLGRLDRALGNMEASARALGQALKQYDALPDPLGKANSLDQLGRLRLKSRDYADAGQYFKKSGILYQSMALVKEARTMRLLQYWTRFLGGLSILVSTPLRMAAISLAGLATIALAFWLLKDDPAGRSLSERVLEARKPNTTPAQYIKPVHSASTETKANDTLLLFVHGIFGDTIDTWKNPNGSSLFGLILNNPEFAKGYHVFVFGYPSAMFKPGSFSVPEAAQTLHTEIAYQQFLKKYKQIVLIAHSMGGLISVELLSTYPGLIEKVPLIVTYGTPYEGAHVAKIGTYLISNPALRDMFPVDLSNSYLMGLNNRWKQIRSQNGGRTRIVCAYEKISLPEPVGMVVPPSSATGLCDSSAEPIPEDHLGIVKPPSEDHGSFKLLVTALRSIQEPAPQAR